MKERGYLDVGVGRADALLDGAERLRVLDGAQFGRQTRAQAAQERRRLLGRRLQRLVRLLVPAPSSSPTTTTKTNSFISTSNWPFLDGAIEQSPRH